MSGVRRRKQHGSLILGAALGISIGQALAETPPSRATPGAVGAPAADPPRPASAPPRHSAKPLSARQRK